MDAIVYNRDGVGFCFPTCTRLTLSGQGSNAGAAYAMNAVLGC